MNYHSNGFNPNNHVLNAHVVVKGSAMIVMVNREKDKRYEYHTIIWRDI